MLLVCAGGVRAGVGWDGFAWAGCGCAGRLVKASVVTSPVPLLGTEEGRVFPRVARQAGCAAEPLHSWLEAGALSGHPKGGTCLKAWPISGQAR